MAHNHKCGNAVTRDCHCGGCAGALHGWKGALALAAPAMAPTRATNRRVSDEAWTKVAKRRFRRQAIRKKARVAVDGARNDVEDWLAAGLADSSSTEPAITAQLVENLGNVVATDVLNALGSELKSGDYDITRRELAESHLFCSLLAEAARDLQQINDNLDAAVDQITAKLVNYCIGQAQIQMPPTLVRVVTKTAATGIENLIDALPVKQHLDSLQRAAEILAVMMCPAPEKHEAVIRYCLKPLGEPVVSRIVQDRLQDAMPEWVR